MTRCIIVDGSSVVRKVAKRILTTPQDVIQEAESGQEALQALKISSPDIIFVDGSLPDLDLTEFITKVRTICELAQPSIVVMLTEMDLVKMTKAKRAGADNYLLKPFDREQLMSRVEKLNEAA
ncbi:response regulator [Oricola sp.]|uniref:response regulator n=1 Tax=Oricola sp. TaxID=1979950 RepID=UPI003BA91EC9